MLGLQLIHGDCRDVLPELPAASVDAIITDPPYGIVNNFGVHHRSDLVAALCPPEGTVLDPYMGSGSTGEACLRLGRRFIGIERDPQWFGVAAERLQCAEPEQEPTEATEKSSVPSAASC